MGCAQLSGGGRSGLVAEVGSRCDALFWRLAMCGSLLCKREGVGVEDALTVNRYITTCRKKSATQPCVPQYAPHTFTSSPTVANPIRYAPTLEPDCQLVSTILSFP